MECKICNNSNNNKVYKIKEMMFGYRHNFDYFQCSRCLCLQIKDIPENLAYYYPDNYYSYSPIENKGIRSFLINSRNKFSILNNGLLGRLLSYIYPNNDLTFFAKLNLSKDSQILDIGCGSGKLLNSFCNAGIQNIMGIDPFNDKDIQYSNGLNILKKTIDEVEGLWDLIILNHSFEHMPNPHKVMNKVYELLNPKGYCAIGIPVINSYAWEKYGVNWVQLDAPRHFFIHSMKSMKILAEENNLVLTDIHYNSTSFQFWGSEQYIKNIPLLDKESYSTRKVSSLFSKKDIVIFEKKAQELNAKQAGDQAIFVFQKVA